MDLKALKKEEFIFRYVNGINWEKYDRFKTKYYIENIHCFNGRKNYSYYVIAYAYEQLVSDIRQNHLRYNPAPMTEAEEIQRMEDYSKIWDDGTRGFGFLVM